VVDDEPKILDIVRPIRKNGCRALTAKNGKEALAALESNRVSPTLPDLMLPKSGGSVFTLRLPRNHASAAILGSAGQKSR
jgi:DNA-binding response OmpR family regulator